MPRVLATALLVSFVDARHVATAQIGELMRAPESEPQRGDRPPPLPEIGGEAVAYTFRAPPVNALGTRAIEELRGTSVLVEFWGTRCVPCVQGAVPASLKLQETYGDELQVLFVEAQGSSAEEMEAFALAQRWLGGRAMWTNEVPFDAPGFALPRFVLLDGDGRVRLSGNPLVQHKEIEREIDAQIQSRRGVPAGVPASLHAAWSELARGRWARADELAAAVESDEHASATARDAARAARAALDARIERSRAAIARRFDEGYVLEAEDELARLEWRLSRDGRTADTSRSSRAIGDDTSRASRVVAGLRARSSEPGVARERAAQVDLARALSRHLASGGDASSAQELLEIAARHPETKAAARAVRVASLLRNR